MADRFDAAAELLRDAILARAFPGAAVEVGGAAGSLWRDAFGTFTYQPDTVDVTADSIYDLASLTKVIATTTLVMTAVDDGRLALSDPVAQHLDRWRGGDRERVTIRDLLEHCSGLSAYLPFYRDCTGRVEFEHAVCSLPLEYAPRARSIYSDLGYMLLGFILEDVQPPAAGFSGGPGTFDPSRSLASQFQRAAARITGEPLRFNPPRGLRPAIAPTEIDPWRGRLLVGEVDDENCWALGGAAGHAGLFGTASAVGAFARAVLRTIAGDPVLASSSTIRVFMRRSSVPDSSRALGWDTMLPTSSCGRRLSPSAVGHTGFTGTSLWIDCERDFYAVLLTNRVYPSRTNDAIGLVRRQFHDLVAP